MNDKYRSMCPHCGRVWETVFMLTPKHYEHMSGLDSDRFCPGSDQYTRNPHSDMRDLWNGEMSPARRECKHPRTYITNATLTGYRDERCATCNAFIETRDRD